MDKEQLMNILSNYLIEKLCDYEDYIDNANALHGKIRTIKEDSMYADFKLKICETENFFTDFFEHFYDFSDFSYYETIFHKLIDKKDF